MTNSPYVSVLPRSEHRLWRARRLRLGHLDIELTERCNNRCIHCLINRSEDDAEARAAEMDTDFIQEVLRQAAELGCRSVRFTGGEPLLRDDFETLYLYARSLGMNVLLFTNGRLITPRLAELFARVPPGDLIEITAYGMHPWSYDAVAGVRGAFDEFWAGVELLREHNIPFIVKGSLLPPNRGEIAEYEALVASLPAMTYPSYGMVYDLRKRRDDPTKSARIAKLRLAPEEVVAHLERFPNYLDGLRDFCSRCIGPPGDVLFTCGMGRELAVDAYGWVQGCLLLCHPDTVYDLKSGSLEHALREFFPALRKRRVTNAKYLERCARCFLLGLCEQCPARSWIEHGTLDTPVEYLCAIAHTQARRLGLLGKDEHSWQVSDWRERVQQLASLRTIGKEVMSKHKYPETQLQRDLEVVY